MWICAIVISDKKWIHFNFFFVWLQILLDSKTFVISQQNKVFLVLMLISHNSISIQFQFPSSSFRISIFQLQYYDLFIQTFSECDT